MFCNVLVTIPEEEIPGGGGGGKGKMGLKKSF